MEKEILLEKYLMNELTDEELLQLQKLVDNDEEFKEELEIRSVLFADYKTDVKQELIKNIPSAKKQTVTLSTKIYKLVRPALSIAAILVLGLLGLWFFQKNNQPNYQQVAMQSLNEAPPGIIVLMDENTNTDTNWNEAVEAYQKKEYKIAAPLFEKSTSKTDERNFYLSLSYLHQNTPIAEKAIPLLTNIIETNSKFAEEANWYLGLAYLLENNPAQSQLFLKKIPRQSGYYKDAKKVLEQISQ